MARMPLAVDRGQRERVEDGCGSDAAAAPRLSRVPDRRTFHDRTGAGTCCSRDLLAGVRMMVKICGITRREDAEARRRAGASAIGFIFWPDSPRFIDPYRARQIAAAAAAVCATVGVFVNQPKEYINGVASVVPLSVIQLHGDEPPAFAASALAPGDEGGHAASTAPTATVAGAGDAAGRCARSGQTWRDGTRRRLGDRPPALARAAARGAGRRADARQRRRRDRGGAAVRHRCVVRRRVVARHQGSSGASRRLFERFTAREYRQS